MDILYVPLGYLLSGCYFVVKNYGLALILFTVIIKFILLPLSVKQKKSMLKQLALRPREESIRKRYKNDKEKQNKEIMELYQKEGFNPMGGCLPLLLQLPIIIALYQVIRNPLTYILHIGRDVVNKIAESLTGSGVVIAQNIYNGTQVVDQIKFYGIINDNQALVSDPSLLSGFRELGFKFLGLDLSMTPTFSDPSFLWIIPIFAGVTAFLSGWYTQRATPQPTQEGMGAAGMTKSMLYVMPVMSLAICFSMPAGVGLYWGISSLLGILQEYLLNRRYKPLEILAKAKAEAEVSNRQKKREKKEIAAKKAAELAAAEFTQEHTVEKKPAKAANREEPGLILTPGKKMSFKFEDDPVIIARIKAHNAEVDRQNGIEPEDLEDEDSPADTEDSFDDTDSTGKEV